MRVCLATPPFYSPVPNEPISLPLGLAYLASTLKSQSFDVSIIDGVLNSVTSVTSRRYLYGYPPDLLARAIADTKPDLIGLSCPFTTRYSLFRQTIEFLRQILPTTPLIVGGVHPTLFPENVLSEAKPDAVVIGEGETTLSEIVSRYNNLNRLDFEGLDGVAWMADGNMRIIPKQKYIQDLDALPPPALELMAIEQYLNRSGGRWASQRHRVLPVITSRSCPGRCSFCSCHAIQGKIWRSHSPARVLTEITRIIEDYSPSLIAFEDDRITWNKERLIEICKRIIQRKLNIRWHTPNGVHVADLDAELLEWMKRSGCISLNLAIESGDEYILHHVIGKKANRQQALDVAAHCHKLGIKINGYFVIGMPGETEQSLQNTYDLCMKLKLDGIGVFIATPFPGTRLFDECAKNNYIDPARLFNDISNAEDAALLNSVIFETPLLSADRIAWWKRKIESDFSLQLHHRKPLLRLKRLAVKTFNKIRHYA